MESIGFLNTLLLLGAVLVLAGILSSLIAQRFGAPLLLVFLVIGMLAGEDGPGGLSFSDYEFTYLVGSLALAVILFDGGLRTRFASFRHTLGPSVVLATIGVVLTAGLTGLFALQLFNVTIYEALLLGAIVGSTDAAAVFFLLRAGGLQLKPRIGATLEIESGTNDPVAVFLTIALIEIILQAEPGTGPTWTIVRTLLEQALIGGAIGVAGGLVAGWFLNRVTLPEGLHPLLVVAQAVLIFALTAVSGGSGFLAVYIAGLVLGNRPLRAAASITSFHDTATWLCQIVMFIVLGLLVTPSMLLDYALPALLIALFMIFVARPAAVVLCLLPFRFSLKETGFISWVGLRGAVSIFLAAIPMLSGLPDAEIYFNVAFVVVLISLLLQGWTLRSLASYLGLALPQSGERVQRVELDLPGQLDYEMAGYPVAQNSPILDRGAVPRWARAILVIRENRILNPHEAGRLQPGDYAYFLTPPERLPRLDRLFATAGDAPPDREAYGEFALRGDAPMARVADLYSLDLSETQRQLTVAGLLENEFDERPDIGDRLPLGGASLVVRELEDERVAVAGLQLEDFAEPPRFAGRAARWLARGRAIAVRLRLPGLHGRKENDVAPPDGSDDTGRATTRALPANDDQAA